MNLTVRNETKLRVRYGETDQMGYCYYGNYAQYFEVGRVEALRELGMSYRELEEAGVMLPVSEFHVRYLRPAKYDDELTIRTEIISLNGVRLEFEYTIENEDKHIIAKAKTTLVFVSKNDMKPMAPPENFLNLLKEHQQN